MDLMDIRATRWLKRIACGALAAGSISLTTGCVTGSADEAFRSAFVQANMESAAAQATENAGKAADRDSVYWNLHAGTAHRAAGHIEASTLAFEAAEVRIKEYDAAPDVSVTGEAGASLTNQSYQPYKGYDYDRIMMNTYKALNYLAIGDPDSARVELRRAYERQTEAVQNNSKRIEKAEEKAREDAQKAGSFDYEKTRNDPNFQNAIDSNYTNLDQFQPYELYANPYTEFLQGLYYSNTRGDASDIESGAKAMSRALGMAPNNSYLTSDLQRAEALSIGGAVDQATYVIFETGMAPVRKTIRIDIPVFLLGGASGGVDYVGAAFPVLEFVEPHEPYISVATSAGGSARSESLCSMDNVIAREFKNDLPGVIARTVVSTAVKAAAAYATNQATKGTKANLVLRLATTAYQLAMNQADERTWHTLPKEVQYCRLPTPADKVLTLTTPHGQSATVTLDAGDVNVVWVRSVGPGAPLVINQFKLR